MAGAPATTKRRRPRRTQTRKKPSATTLFFSLEWAAITSGDWQLFNDDEEEVAS
jgi:hypothetical protein